MFKCDNSNYDECNNEVKHEGELCQDCECIAADFAAEQAASDFFGGDLPYTLKEKHEAIFNELIKLGIK